VFAKLTSRWRNEKRFLATRTGDIVAGALALACVAGCGGQVVRGHAVSDTPSAEVLAGSAVRESDVQTIPDVPLAAGVVIVVPAGAIQDFWRSLGETATGPAEPQRAQFTVERSTLPAAVEVAPIAAGRFAAVGSGPGALFCLAPDASGASLPVVGCAVLPDTGTPPTRVRLAHGEAGVTVRPS
jgi:hypothetical protein